MRMYAHVIFKQYMTGWSPARTSHFKSFQIVFSLVSDGEYDTLPGQTRLRQPKRQMPRVQDFRVTET